MVETEAWHYLSVRISRGEIHLALRDLSSKLVVEEQLGLALEHPQPFLTRVVAHIDQFFIRHQKKLERLTAIAVTLPGIIDTENGVIHRMPFYDEVKDLPLGEFWRTTPASRSIFSTISAPGRWRSRCLARPRGAGCYSGGD
jgi:transcriptional regulator of PTS gene